MAFAVIRIFAVRSLLATAITLLVSCNATKHVPQGQYLVNKVRIEVKDNPDIDKKEMRNYLRQTNNHEIFGGLKFQLAIYNMSGKDSTKWYNRWLRKAGQAPVIYDQSLTDASVEQLRQALANKGYLHAEVHADTFRNEKKRKIEVEYNIYANQPHYIQSVTYNIPNDTLRSLILADSSKFILHKNVLFDRNELDKARQNISDRLRQQGYFGFNKEYITFTADTTAGSNAVDLTLNVMPPYANRVIHYDRHRPFYIRNIYVITNHDPSSQYANGELSRSDTIVYNGLNIVYGESRYLRPKIIDENCFISSGEI